MEKFIKLIRTMNELHEGISNEPMYWFEEVNNRLYIYAGLQSDLMKLWLLLHTKVYNYIMYYEICRDEDGEEPVIRIIKNNF